MDPRLRELTESLQDLSLNLDELSSEEIVNYLKEVITDSQGKKKLKEIEDSLYIIFKFQKDGTVIYDKIAKSRLKNYTSSVVLYNLVSDDWRVSKSCDLSEFSHDAFREILKYLDTNKLPQLKKENFDDILELANYIIPGDHYFHDNFNVRDDRFFMKSLREYDLFLITEEKKLRTFLSTNRDRDVDQKFELNKIIKEVRPHCERKGISNVIPPQKVCTIAKKPAVKINEDYYGIPFLPTKDSITFPFKAQLDSLRYNFITNIDQKIVNEQQITADDLFNNINNAPLHFLRKEKLIRYLKNLRYKNYCIAGGFLTSDYRETDIDFFITTKNESEAREAILNIYVNAIENNITDPVAVQEDIWPIHRYEEMIIVNDHSITFSFSGFKVQIILRLYNSITEVISGFDIDMSCVAFDGKKFYCMPRFVRSIISKYILVDPERQSTTYAQRLYKYRSRYCDIAIPGIEKHKITSDFDDVEGLAKLLKKIYSSKEFIEDSLSYNTAVMFPNTRSLNNAIVKIAIKHQRKHQIQPIFMEEEAGEQNVIDYVVNNNIEIPFRIVSNIEDVFEDEVNLEFPYRFAVRGPIKFKTEDPGSQVSGSFFPTTEEWYTDLFLN